MRILGYIKKVLVTLHKEIKNIPQQEKKYQITNLMKFFDEFTDVKPAEDATFSENHTELMPYTDMIYDYLKKLNSSAIANAGGIVDKISGLQIDHQGERLTLRLFDDPIQLYKWQVEHRNPQRQYDSNYKKHSKENKYGKNGKVISSVTYKQEDLECFLKFAVRASKTKDELYFYDAKKEKYIIFFNENTNSLYHAFEFTKTDNVNIQAIWNRGGRDLTERIDTLSKYFENVKC